MHRVWIVEYIDYEEFYIAGVFKKQGDADKFCKEQNEIKKGYRGDYFHVEMYEVK